VTTAAAFADIRRRNNVTVLDGGGRPALVFVNGFGCDQSIWRFVAPAFARDRRVVLFDYVGTGGADPGAYDPARYGSLDAHARDLLEIVGAIGPRGADLVAHSMGCSVAVKAAVRAPERFARLVLVGHSPRFLNDPPDYEGGFERPDVDALLALYDENAGAWAAALAGMLAKEAGAAAELRDRFCAIDPRAARPLAELAFLSDGRADLPRVRQPCLSVQCARDDVVPPAVAEYVRRALPRCAARSLDVDGHCPHLTHPRLLEAAVREFLDAGAAAGGG
jgi:sigma-B regulation protein RsbQ